MRMDILSLFRRDFKKAMNLRTLIIWTVLAAMGVFFFYTSGGKTKLVESDQIEFMALFLPHMIFGSWAVLSSYFDLVSSDREHNVLDCIICSGIPKTRIFISKFLVTAVMSLVMSFIYMTPVTCAIIWLSGNFTHIFVLMQYLLPLWGYIMVYAAMGMLISVLARSSKAALIWSLAIGLLLMPRFFVMIVEGIGKVFGWTAQMVENFSLIAPGVMMQALSEVSDITRFSLAAAIFGIGILLFLIIAYLIFIKQDEYNYGE